MLYDLIIIGGGPAAMSAAIYASRKKLKTLLLAEELGGQMIEGYMIENYLGIPQIPGIELAEKFIKHLKNFDKKLNPGNYDLEIKEGGVVLKIEKKGDNFLAQTEKNHYEGRSLIIATGKRQRVLDVPGAKQFEGKGITYCATCDAPLFRDKITAVIGAGDSGQDTAWQLTQYAKKVYIINKYPDLRGSNVILKEKIKTADKGKLEIINNVLPKEIKGDKFVQKLVYFNSETQEEKEIEVDGIFVEIGSMPATDFLNGLIELNAKSEIIINPKTNAASAAGIFAAGDATDIPFKQIIIAAGEGAKAALSAYEYLKNKKYD